MSRTARITIGHSQLEADRIDRSRSNPQPAGQIAIEGDAGVLVARIDGGPHALFDPEIARQLKALVDRADRARGRHPVRLGLIGDPAVRGVV
jgi:hypothetical protein